MFLKSLEDVCTLIECGAAKDGVSDVAVGDPVGELTTMSVDTMDGCIRDVRAVLTRALVASSEMIQIYERKRASLDAMIALLDKKQADGKSP